MKVAIMQPYFFPYIGYWQLIHAVDLFVLLDDVQYIRHGWINRNRILKPGGGGQYILVPLKKHSPNTLIRNVAIHPTLDWKQKIIRQLGHYKKKAAFFTETMEIVQSIFSSTSDHRIAYMILDTISEICKLLGLNRRLKISSECGFDYSRVSNAGEWALRIAEQLGADEYINPIDGAELFNSEAYKASGISLKFLEPESIVYSQGGIFEPWLSIIDMLMFNGVDGTKDFLNKYNIIQMT